MTEGLYINGEAVDLKPDAATTLNYKSNLLGDISKITSSNSQTIQCPKTTRNRKIFDNPGAPAYVSDKRYNRYSARLVRNGIEVVRVGYAVLLSSSETYEIALYWGVMANFQTWVDKAAKLNELTGTEALAWNANTTPTTLSQMKSTGYGFAKIQLRRVECQPCQFPPQRYRMVDSRQDNQAGRIHVRNAEQVRQRIANDSDSMLEPKRIRRKQ